MGSTAKIRFDQEGQEILISFITHVASVLNNAMLVIRLGDANSSLSNALIQLKEAQAQLVQSEKLASLGQMMAGLVHEMNNPLTFVMGNFEHILPYVNNLQKLINICLMEFEPSVPKKVQQMIVDIEYEYLKNDLQSALSDMNVGLDRVRRIITDLTAFSAQDRGDMHKTDLSQIIDSTINILRYQWVDTVKISLELDEIQHIVCNSGQIGQVILNLLSNAIHSVKSIERPGLISVRLYQEGQSVNIEIEDNGIGIPEENMDKLFQPFFTTKKIGEGIGLGLSISHGIIKRHGGSLTCESEIDKGTLFRIKIPYKW